MVNSCNLRTWMGSTALKLVWMSLGVDWRCVGNVGRLQRKLLNPFLVTCVALAESRAKNLFLLKWKETFFLSAMERIFFWWQSKTKGSVGHPAICSLRLSGLYWVTVPAQIGNRPCPVGFRVHSFPFFFSLPAVLWGWSSLRGMEGEWLLSNAPILALKTWVFLCFPNIPFSSFHWNFFLSTCL